MPATTPADTLGNNPRASLYGPGQNVWDISLMRDIPIFERMRFPFRADAHNAFNHPQFYAPTSAYAGCDPNSGSGCASSFGQITNAYPSRVVQWAGKFYW